MDNSDDTLAKLTNRKTFERIQGEVDCVRAAKKLISVPIDALITLIQSLSNIVQERIQIEVDLQENHEAEQRVQEILFAFDAACLSLSIMTAPDMPSRVGFRESAEYYGSD